MKFSLERTIVENFDLKTYRGILSEGLESFKDDTGLNTSFFKDISLLEKYEEVISQEGMDLSTAIAINEIIPNFINDEIPSSVYTKTASPVNASYALESINRYVSDMTKLDKYLM